MSGPVLQAHIFRYLGNNGIEIEILSTTTKERTFSVVMRWCKNRYVEELHLKDPEHNSTSSDYWKDMLQKRTWFDKDGAIIEHRGNSCKAVHNSDESSVQLFRRIYFY